MKKIFTNIINKLLSFSSIPHSIFEMSEILHFPWHVNEVILISTFILWFIVVRISTFLFVEFKKRFEFVFCPSNCRFFLWVMYITLVVLTFSMLLFNYFDGMHLRALFIKTLVSLIFLIHDYKVTSEATYKFNKLSCEVDPMLNNQEKSG